MWTLLYLLIGLVLASGLLLTGWRMGYSVGFEAREQLERRRRQLAEETADRLIERIRSRPTASDDWPEEV